MHPRSISHFTFIGLLGLTLSVAACGGAPAEALEHVRRGDAALGAGRYAEAVAAFNRARELAPTDPAMQRAAMRGRMFLLASEPGRIAPDALGDVQYEATLLADTDPTNRAVYLTALAHVAMRENHADEAKTKLEEAVKLDPASAIPHAALGALLWSRKENPAQIKAEFEAALKAKPDHIGALMGMAQVKAAERDLPGAIAAWTAALKVRDDAGARMELGQLYVEQQKPAEAAAEFQRAAQLDPKNADALGAWGQALLSAGRAEDAERVLRSALDLRADPASFMALGYALARQKKAGAALDVFSRVIERDPTAAPAHYGAALAAEDLGKTELALAHYRALIALSPTGPEAARRTLAEMQQDANKRVAALAAGPTGPTGSAAPAAPPARPGLLDNRK